MQRVFKPGTLRDFLKSLRDGWVASREYYAKRLPPNRPKWYHLPTIWIKAYCQGINPVQLVLFPQGAFNFAEIEEILSCLHPSLGPLLVNRVQVSVTTNQIPVTTTMVSTA